LGQRGRRQNSENTVAFTAYSLWKHKNITKIDELEKNDERLWNPWAQAQYNVY